ncbi:hypothetical protein CIV90_27015 [Escherichia coli]|nr:hypothetical protein [Escherichia coli]
MVWSKRIIPLIGCAVANGGWIEAKFSIALPHKGFQCMPGREWQSFSDIVTLSMAIVQYVPYG